MIRGLLNKSASVTRKTGSSNTGPRPTVTTTVVETAAPCRIVVQSAKELGPSFDAEVQRVRLYFLYGVNLQNSDLVTIDGASYEVEVVNQDAGGEQHHVQADAKRVK